jgi:Predicted membrane protein (DUF2142)
MTTPEESPAPQRGRWLRLVLIALALWVCTLAWALSSPPGASPDEDAHLSAAWAVTHGQSPTAPKLTIPDSLFVRYCYPAAIAHGPCYAAPAAIGSTYVTHTNLTAGYPLTFHWLEGQFFRPGLDASVLSIRAFVAFSCVLLVMLPLVLISLFAGDDAIGTIGVPLVVTLSPLAFFLFGSVNPSSWDMAGAICGWGCFVALVQAKRRLHVLLALVGILVGILAGALARPHGGLLLVIALPLAGPVALARVAPASVVARRWFWAIVGASYVIVGGLSVALILRGALTIRWSNHPPPDPHSPVWHWLSDLPRAGDYVFGSWGGGQFGPLGWLDTAMPAIVPLVFVAAVGYLLIEALRQRRPELSLSLLMTTVGSLFLTTAVLASGIPPDGSVQTRYLWPAYIGVTFTAAAGLARTNKGWVEQLLEGHVRLVLGLGLISAGSVAFFTNLRRYATGLSEFPYVSPALWRPAVLGFGPLVAVFVVAYAALIYLLTTSRLPTVRLPWPRRRAEEDEPVEDSSVPELATEL